MKLNLGCGQDVRTNYVNIDIQGGPGVIKGDFKVLDSVQEIKGQKFDEIVAIDVLRHIAPAELGTIIPQWASLLEPGGTIYFESLDYNLLGVILQYDQTQTEQICQLIYPSVGIYNLIEFEAFLKRLGLETQMKGYTNPSFFITVKK